jgi:hypothetical protein
VADEDDVGVERARPRDVTERALEQRDFRHSDTRSFSSLSLSLGHSRACCPQQDLTLAERKPSTIPLAIIYVHHIRQIGTVLVFRRRDRLSCLPRRMH